MRKLVDLSHTIEHGMVTYKGLPAPIICDYLSRESSRPFYEEGTSFQIGRIDMVANTGTYVDCPFHRYENGKDLSEVELERFANLPAMVVRADYRQGIAVDVHYFENRDVKGKAVLINTNWDEHWRTDRYFEQHPYVTERAARWLHASGAVLVGIDSHNMDDTRTRSRPAHTILLGAEILVVEHLCNLAALPEDGFLFSAVPPKFKGVGTFPVRAFASQL